MKHMNKTRRDLLKKMGLGVAAAVPLISMTSCQNNESEKLNKAKGNILDYGAVGDGKTINTKAIQKTIDEVANNGGGMVIVPAGTFLSGTINLRSRITLFLETGAVLKASRDIKLFQGQSYEEFFAEKKAAIRSQGKTAYGREEKDVFSNSYRAFILAENQDDINIAGFGTIDGNYDEAINWDVFTGDRVWLVLFKNCRRIHMRDISLINSEFWCINVLICTDVHLRGLTIRNCRERITTDGIDIVSSKKVIISDCNIDVGDDTIAIHDHFGLGSEDIVITNCLLRTTCHGVRVGVESANYQRNITVSNCIMDTPKPLGLQMCDGGIFENIRFMNIQAKNVDSGILMYIHPRYGKEEMGNIRNITIDGLSVEGKGRICIVGIPERHIKNLNLRNIFWRIPKSEKPYEFKVHGTAAQKWAPLPDGGKYEKEPYHITIARVNDVVLENICIEDEDMSFRDRGLIYTPEVEHLVTNNVRWGTKR